MRTLPFKRLKRGHIFTLPGENRSRQFVKLGNSGARVYDDGKLGNDAIPALDDECHIVGHIAEGLYNGR